jgi:hypothetical protein
MSKDSTKLNWSFHVLNLKLNSTGNLMASSVQFSSVESLDMYFIYDDLRRPPTVRDWPQASLNMFRIIMASRNPVEWLPAKQREVDRSDVTACVLAVEL